ncbi:hypothetical protein AUEXF2481DRAFT_40188 [Aureobasidium subglaciale EXF-2481]|uniref:Uncharacterized protein n=1 Tax=Aureobasidium subglaciale (strain EXF-2481) TaxID=1043005 RepID=A0A074YAW9_AURSE|nr:uncharacterized protein AUEXF2481DRAFT_40188 [Aureobasidium subglaciale EXF-2481]KEQ94943.1 hypothetical protein AUEXF2481DRAFT_40188 [Aureobasidium subglaciale EXF-2481]
MSACAVSLRVILVILGWLNFAVERHPFSLSMSWCRKLQGQQGFLHKLEAWPNDKQLPERPIRYGASTPRVGI